MFVFFELHVSENVSWSGISYCIVRSSSQLSDCNMVSKGEKKAEKPVVK